MSTHTDHKTPFASLALGAVGIVFGDIGTSPLYALGECFSMVKEHSGRAPEPEEVLGLLSLVFWALTLVVTVKYLAFVMRADNHGEGGILALLAIVPEKLRATTTRGVPWVAVIVIIGAGLLYGDGAITPAISVLSAVEGIGVARTTLVPWVVPITCAILVALFAIQSRGTAAIGKLFGPVMVLWFVTIGALGAVQLVKNPSVLAALSPHHAAAYLTTHGAKGPLILGAIVLAVTGGEALYADMGHFGARPIRAAWLVLVKPALLLCYFGMGAHVLARPEAAENPFFSLVDGEGKTFALVLLSSAATVIASQALISGAYSLTRQAIQLGYMPRVTVKHTASDAEGQIYVPGVNWALMIACVVLVVVFGKSARLAAAYGIAVTGTMGVTSVVYYLVMRRTWRWSVVIAAPILLLFLAFDVPFFLANVAKILDGGYVPIAMAAVMVAVMLVWSRGRRIMYELLGEKAPPVGELAAVASAAVARVPGTAVFLASDPTKLPPSLVRHVRMNRVLHEKIIVVAVKTQIVPVVAEKDRAEVTKHSDELWVVKLAFGFMEIPEVVDALTDAARANDLPYDPATVTYYLGRETILAGPGGKMDRITEALFAFLQRNALAADRHFALPPSQVVEIGSQVDL